MKILTTGLAVLLGCAHAIPWLKQDPGSAENLVQSMTEKSPKEMCSSGTWGVTLRSYSGKYCNDKSVCDMMKSNCFAGGADSFGAESSSCAQKCKETFGDDFFTKDDLTQSEELEGINPQDMEEYSDIQQVEGINPQDGDIVQVEGINPQDGDIVQVDGITLQDKLSSKYKERKELTEKMALLEMEINQLEIEKDEKNEKEKKVREDKLKARDLVKNAMRIQTEFMKNRLADRKKNKKKEQPQDQISDPLQ